MSFRKWEMDELNRLSVEDFKKEEKLPIIVFLDQVRSMANVGSVFRTADAFKLNAVYLGGFTPKPPHREIHKTALGATESVDWQHVDDGVAALLELKEKGWKVVAVELAEGATSLDTFKVDSTEKYVLVLGNEVEGVSEEVLEVCDACIQIPQFGTKHSLNISVSAGILLWEFTKSHL